MDKKKIKAALLDRKKKLLEGLQNTLKFYKEGADLEEGTTLDNEDFAHQNEWTDFARHIEGQIARVSNELSNVEDISLDANKDIAFGSLVKLKGKSIYYLLGISFPKLEIDGQTVVGVSKKAPMYKLLDGLTEGGTFRWNNKEQKVEEVS